MPRRRDPPGLRRSPALPEIRGLAVRPVNPIQVIAEQVRKLERDIFPYWFSRSVLTRSPLAAREPEAT